MKFYTSSSVQAKEAHNFIYFIQEFKNVTFIYLCLASNINILLVSAIVCVSGNILLNSQW